HLPAVFDQPARHSGLRPEGRLPAPTRAIRRGSCHCGAGVSGNPTNSPGLTTTLTRSIAKVGFGIVLEKQAADPGVADPVPLRNQALDQYLDVLFGKVIGDKEIADDYWTARAGLEAIRLAGEMQAWQKVVNICDTLGAKLPQMASRLS